jgi:hypothetical protein
MYLAQGYRLIPGTVLAPHYSDILFTVLQIRYLLTPWIRDPGSVRSGSGMFIPGSYFRELRNNFWVKIPKFFDGDAHPDPVSGNLLTLYPGSGMK